MTGRIISNTGAAKNPTKSKVLIPNHALVGGRCIIDQKRRSVITLYVLMSPPKSSSGRSHPAFSQSCTLALLGIVDML